MENIYSLLEIGRKKIDVWRHLLIETTFLKKKRYNKKFCRRFGFKRTATEFTDKLMLYGSL
jgi:hypothetical protein